MNEKSIMEKAEEYKSEMIAKYRGIGYREGMDIGIVLDRFAEFIYLRFGAKEHESYIMEWIPRFQSGHPDTWMDSNSKRIYKEILFGDD